ncbi:MULTISPECIES: hypothetical protein [unclassified Caballeronia]|uniref:hypothetical protein n=1 Tax=unclassified Caballeronia TaxID=2646786 RepID=UPI002029AB9D|nr:MULTISPECIES: hypothetical protein [unclassified Caballeronia]
MSVLIVEDGYAYSVAKEYDKRGTVSGGTRVKASRQLQVEFGCAGQQAICVIARRIAGQLAVQPLVTRMVMQFEERVYVATRHCADQVSVKRAVFELIAIAPKEKHGVIG